MKVTFFSDGIEVRECAAGEEQVICDLVDRLQLELETLPRKGDLISFNIGKYILQAEVDYSCINYCEPGNELFKELYWGVNYNVFLSYIELIEEV